MNDNNFQNYPQQEGVFDSFLNVIQRLRKIAHPPIFEESEEKSRQASILYTFLVGTLIFSIVVNVLIVFTSNKPLIVGSLLLFIELIMVAGIILIRRGHINFTGRMITTIFWIFIATVSIFYDNLINPTTPSFIIVVIIAGLTVSARAAVTTTLLTIVYSIVYIFLQNASILTPLLNIDVLNYIILAVFDMAMAAFLTVIANRTTNQTLNQLNATRQDLIDSNQELSEIQTYLQETVTQRTNQLEKRTHYLEAASQVAKQSLSTFNLQEMLDKIALLISDQFGFYHVGIFLLDDRGEWAVLRAASSPGGKQMIARNHRLEVGRQGIVGFVTSIGQARISQDIELDRIHSVTLELPDTRAEMALPLIARNKMIGALDIQDSNPNVFSEDDIPVLQTVADQIALAVENIRLYQQTQESLEEIQRVYGEYTQQAWFETYQKNLLRSYRYSSGAVETIPDSDYIQPIGNKVSVPIQIRGYNIGAIEISKEESPDEWTDDELRLLHTLSEQLGIALDSARLYNETQLRASTEHAISQISSDLWENMDINSILKTAAQKLRETLAVPEVTVRLTQPAILESQNGNKEEHVEIAEEVIEEEIEE